MRHITKASPALLLILTAALFAQDISGIYTGTMKADRADGPQEERGTIILKQDGGKLVVTGGPSVDQQFPAVKVERDGDLLKFEIAPPGDSVTLLQFQVTVKGGKITGDVKSTRGSESFAAKLEFSRQ
jgi:hypothetical protein